MEYLFFLKIILAYSFQLYTQINNTFTSLVLITVVDTRKYPHNYIETW